MRTLEDEERQIRQWRRLARFYDGLLIAMGAALVAVLSFACYLVISRWPW